MIIFENNNLEMITLKNNKKKPLNLFKILKNNIYLKI